MWTKLRWRSCVHGSRQNSVTATAQVFKQCVRCLNSSVAQFDNTLCKINTCYAPARANIGVDIWHANKFPSMRAQYVYIARI